MGAEVLANNTMAIQVAAVQWLSCV